MAVFRKGSRRSALDGLRPARPIAGPGVFATRTAAGTSLAASPDAGAGDGGFWAILDSAVAGPNGYYRFRELVPRKPPGFAVKSPGGRAGVVAEENGIAGLAGKRMRVYGPGPYYRGVFHRRAFTTANCQNVPTFTFSISISCCCPMSDPVTVTWTYGGRTIGSCVATPTIVESPDGAGCYRQTETNGLCRITTDLPLGTVVDWTATGAIVGTYSGTMTVQCDGDGVGVLWAWVDTLPATLHVTDPDGFAVPLTLTAPFSRTWQGSHTSTRTDSKGATQTFVTNYSWFGCGLAFGSYGYDPCPSRNSFGGHDTSEFAMDDSVFMALPNWPTPPDKSESCFPLSIAYTPWYDTIGSVFHHGVIKQWKCADLSLFGLQFAPSGATYTKWTCGSQWLLTV